MVSDFRRYEPAFVDLTRQIDSQSQVLRDVVAVGGESFGVLIQNLEKNNPAEATDLENLTAEVKTWMKTLSKKLAKKYGKKLAKEIIHEMREASAPDAYDFYDDDGFDGDDGADDGEYGGDDVGTWGGQEEDVEGSSWVSDDTYEGGGAFDDGEGGSWLLDIVDVLFSIL
ncbi:hypothetical protein CspHIS471_0303750 [Cutaneotrichosporon sp. HIS471]|nr:hypothetical protein CspHIS471_0303750 [Cutaneotrichosporon sp. HIS471]